jgi:hypothetical protein
MIVPLLATWSASHGNVAAPATKPAVVAPAAPAPATPPAQK